MPRLGPWVAVAAYLATIFYLSSQSNPLPELTTRFWDKGLHFVEYGTLGALLLFALRRSGLGGRGAGGSAFGARARFASGRRCLPWIFAAAGASLYGASDELHQAFVPGRSCDLLDWLADSLGGAAGAALLALALRLWRAPASIRPASGRG